MPLRRSGVLVKLERQTDDALGSEKRGPSLAAAPSSLPEGEIGQPIQR